MLNLLCSLGFTPSTGSNPDPLFRTQTTAVKNEDPKKIADVPLQTNNYRPRLDPTKTPRPFQRSDFSIDRARHELEPPTRSAFFSIRDDPLYFSNPNPLPPSPISSLIIPSTSRSHILIPVHRVVLFSSASLLAFSCLVYFLGSAL